MVHDIAGIERIAAKGLEMPDGLSQPEQTLFMSLRILYREHRQGIISKEQAQKEKKRLITAYEYAAFIQNANLDSIHRTQKASRELVGAERGNCPKCKLVMRILDGRERSEKG